MAGRVIIPLAVGLVCLSWILRAATAYVPFQSYGFDFGSYYAQALVLRDDPARIYDIHAALGRLPGAAPVLPGMPLYVGPVSYPPAFALLMVPLTYLPVDHAWLLWSITNLAATVWLASHAASHFRPERRGLVTILALLSTPAFASLFYGQPTPLLGAALSFAYDRLQRQRDLRAGMWLGLLAIKPHYLIFLSPWLIVRRRWGAVAGLAVTVAVIALLSLAAVGTSTLLTYPLSLADQGDFSGTGGTANVGVMVNWRALLVLLWPDVGSATGIVIVTVLGVLTLVPLVVRIRKTATPNEEGTSLECALVLMATVLVSYHSHAHGILLLLAPLCEVLSDPRYRYSRTIATLGVIVPVFLMAPMLLLSGDVSAAYPLTGAFLLLLYASLLWESRPAFDGHPAASASVMGQTEASPNVSAPFPAP